jgi:opacity protein-like surface antigen
MLKNVFMKGLLVGAMLMCATAASAQDLGRQTVNFTLGYFTPLGYDARDDDDVLNANSTFLLFDIDDFNGASVGGEWLFPLARHIEGGIGVSYFSQTVPSVYADFVDPDGTEVDQDLHLRLVPLAFTVRLIPVDPRSPIQPYVGGGVGLISWEYSEVGEFIDFNAGREIFNERFEKSGTNAGPLVLGGIRFAGDAFSTGFEIRYQWASGDLDPDFAAPKIDLGGWTYNFTAGVRF